MTVTVAVTLLDYNANATDTRYCSILEEIHLVFSHLTKIFRFEHRGGVGCIL